MTKEIKTYVFDLDNTLCKTDGSNYIDSTPYIDRIKKVNKLHDQGHIIIVETARGCVSGKKWFTQTMSQLKSWGLKFDTLRAGVKFSADYYVDDKGINSEDYFDNKSLNKESGSGVKTNVYIVNRVLKEATDERVDKLIDEINFIENMPSQFKNKFPKIVFSKIENNKAFYEMQHHKLPTIRRLILSGDINSEEIIRWSDRITGFSMDMYGHEKIDISDKAVLDALHWSRYTNRMTELSRKSSWFSDVLCQEDIIINEKKYKNLNFLFNKIKTKEMWFKPEFVGRWSHSDLHFSNILIDRDKDDFVLIDPRGYDFCEYYYDFGKLWHSVNGKYELIAARKFDVSDIASDNSFNIHENYAYRELDKCKSGIMDMLKRHSNETPDQVVLKTEFNDVMHFATLIPFLLEFDHREDKSRVAYYQSVILMNNFCKKHGII
tara:strand:+ start:1574 stop:2878 length:1305 start_codon:yes stop_codon:yes gene_type:complete